MLDRSGRRPLSRRGDGPGTGDAVSDSASRGGECAPMSNGILRPLRRRERCTAASRMPREAGEGVLSLVSAFQRSRRPRDPPRHPCRCKGGRSMGCSLKQHHTTRIPLAPASHGKGAVSSWSLSKTKDLFTNGNAPPSAITTTFVLYLFNESVDVPGPQKLSHAIVCIVSRLPRVVLLFRNPFPLDEGPDTRLYGCVGLRMSGLSAMDSGRCNSFPLGQEWAKPC
ncbi:hypothetical protein VTK73DRAFT_6352 [Phialemonium thermophilum]|uniref:Uncharacterized protein n=1 Tax=Phialemonium thermophilum TaxID=223376 RepID=A0ABR3WJM8_9PEZI